LHNGNAFLVYASLLLSTTPPPFLFFVFCLYIFLFFFLFCFVLFCLFIYLFIYSVKQFGTYTQGLFAMATLGLLVREALVTNAAIDQVVRGVGPIPEVYYIQAVQHLMQVGRAKRRRGGELVLKKIHK
jgi:hypothetical protein